MANTITSHTIVNGSRNLIVQFNLVADGSGNLSDFNLLDVDDYSGLDNPAPNDFKVKKVSGRCSTGASFKLKFGSTSQPYKLFFESPVAEEFEQEWEGGLSNKLLDQDMSVRMSTTGFDVANDAITVVVWLVKKTKNLLAG